MSMFVFAFRGKLLNVQTYNLSRSSLFRNSEDEAGPILNFITQRFYKAGVTIKVVFRRKKHAHMD